MKKLTLITSFLLTATLGFAQCDKPTKYEDNKYDYVYNWQDILATQADSFICSKYNQELIDLRCVLRNINKSRAYITSLPLEVQNLNYTKSLLLADKTIPVWKLIDINIINKEESLINDFTILMSNIQTSSNLPSKYISYLALADKPVEYKFYDDDWQEYTDTIAFTWGNTSWSRFDICLGKDSKGYINSKTIPRVYIRCFIDSTGECSYVDYETMQTDSCTSNILKFTEDTNKGLIFKPAMRNNKPCGSYIVISICPWVYSEEEWKKLKERDDAAKLEGDN